MAMTRVTAGNEASIDDLNQLIDLLQGTSGFTESFLLRCAASSDFKIRLADAAGARRFEIQDSAGTAVAYIDSDGNLTVGGFVLPTSASPSQTTEGSLAWDSDDDVLTAGTGAATKRLGLTRGAGSNASATAEIVYDTTAARLKIWDGSASQSIGDFTWIRKAAAETVNNSSTLQDDDDFQFTVAANTDYLVEMGLSLTTNTTADFKFAWTLTNMTWDAGWVSGMTPESNTATTITNNAGVTSGTAKALNIATTAAAATPVPVMTFLIHAGSSGGTLKFQWAQNAGDLSNTSLLKNSWLRYRALGAS